MHSTFLPIAVSLLLAPIQAGAEERKSAPTATITLDENGLPMVSVTLHSLKNPNMTRTFRFVLDTGSGWCVVDQSVPSEFFWDENQIEANPRDVANQVVASSTVLLKRIEVGGLTRDGVIASRMDLRNQIGRVQDHPMDGILGMSFLRGTRFLIEPKENRLRWWGYHFSPGMTVPITLGNGGVPWLTLRLGKQEAMAILDTGMSGGVDLPPDLRPKGEGEAMVTTGASGKQMAGSQMIVDRLDAGTGAWTHLPVNFESEGSTGRIGTDVWLAAPVCFDFITDNLTFSIDAEGNLPIRREPSRKLPLMWDRSGDIPHLVIVLVKPGSALEKAGCKVGDELIQVGDFRGQAITRRAVQDLVASGAKHTWIVRRNGQSASLIFDAK
jgi:predicted aspartyl protease